MLCIIKSDDLPFQNPSHKPTTFLNLIMRTQPIIRIDLSLQLQRIVRPQNELLGAAFPRPTPRNAHSMQTVKKC